jgi:uncharacterized protein (TIGR03435 family)
MPATSQETISYRVTKRGRAAERHPLVASRTLGITILAAGLAAAQNFDVASVRESQGRGKPVVETSPGSVMIEASFAYILGWAYDLRRYQIAGPDWIKSKRYRIAAKAEKPAKAEEMRRMMQSLVEERFQLKSHREQREMWVYALVAATGEFTIDVNRAGQIFKIRVSQ